jgi:hypothetical protein
MPVTEPDLLAGGAAGSSLTGHQDPQPLLHTQVTLLAAGAPATPLGPQAAGGGRALLFLRCFAGRIFGRQKRPIPALAAALDLQPCSSISVRAIVSC